MFNEQGVIINDGGKWFRSPQKFKQKVITLESEEDRLYGKMGGASIENCGIMKINKRE
jgi:hypothetical protein